MVVMKIKISEIFLEERIFLEKIIEGLEKESVINLSDTISSAKNELEISLLIDNVEELIEEFSREEVLFYLKEIQNNIFFADEIDIQTPGYPHFNSIIIIFRILMGNVQVINNENNINNNSDMVSQMFQTTINVTNDEKILENIQVDAMGKFISEFYPCNETDSIAKLYTQNKKFYDSLLNEFLQFYDYQNKKSYFSAFIHLYRIYEYISYVFPLIYVRNNQVYQESYEALQSFFKQNGKELTFFSTFIRTTFIKDPYILVELYNEKYTIDLTPEEYQVISTHLATFITQFDNKRASENTKYLENITNGISKVKYTYLDCENQNLHISTLDMHDFIILLRNKTCHFKMNHKDNIALNSASFDELFSILNPVILNWISNIFKFIVAKSFN
ncbi:hypothetical protein [Enterococcus mundtii]|uniref:Uncharacterized protein n=1 Tax=Enterococcus mundtii TaxID=53346 RepID=A0A2S7RZC1_ENTMU|nr:hypothetical protein [Enterococcus mundtii]PQF25592.1 hypothetical protein CUS89_01010 [Enterococcus mundtii]